MISACHKLLLYLLFCLAFQNLYAQKKVGQTAKKPELRIDSVRLVPDADRWVKAGDELRIEMFGAPGQKAFFLDDQPLAEVSPGIYRGRYIVRQDDLFHDEPVEAYVHSGDNIVSRETGAKVRYLANDTSALSAKKRTSLYYGLGDDRLGGAKMGTIDSAIRLRICGKVGDMYQTRLAADRTAWLAEEDIRFDGQTFDAEPALSGSWMIKSEGKYDVLKLSLPQRRPYISFTEIDPATITIDLFNVNSNTNWITQRGTMPAISNSWYEQPSEGVLRVHLRLAANQLWGYRIGYEGNTLVVRVKHAPEKLQLSDLKIVLDAGHGGTNLGAKGASGQLEKNITLQIVQKLGKQFERAGAQVFYTRKEDVTLDMPTRIDIAEAADPDLMISIHCNSSGNKTVQGTSTYYKHVAFKPLSQYIQNEDLKLGLADFGNVGSFNFSLNSPTAFPNVLVETAFISNTTDEQKLLDEKFQQSLANS
ncbi:MAG: N-acetylmuramoyl-L-alanine amidase, partial [Mucilaginibacter polytrichastri]|nr:N-acetylmuramoyl-L-alanine amidase [Mucilaginibacter polytrichastri]